MDVKCSCRKWSIRKESTSQVHVIRNETHAPNRISAPPTKSLTISKKRLNKLHFHSGISNESPIFPVMEKTSTNGNEEKLCKFNVHRVHFRLGKYVSATGDYNHTAASHHRHRRQSSKVDEKHELKREERKKYNEYLCEDHF